MKKKISSSLLLALIVALLRLSGFAAENPFLGAWELTIPGGAAGWLGVDDKGGKLEASMMWGSGSVEPVASAKLEGERLVLTRNHEVERSNPAGKKTKSTFTETITATLNGDQIHLVSVQPDEKNPSEEKKEEFSGRRQPPMPPAPDLSKLKFHERIVLFNGKDLTGWRLTDPNAVNGWSVQDGLLVNNPVQEKGHHKNYGNLRTDREFEDFNLHVEVRVNKGENSGVYLRGIYEVQVADTYGKTPDPHNMGAVYSRIKPTVAAENPPGEWQTMDITLLDRHVTVILNGKKIIDNKPVMGCTGGALWSDVSRPGPIYLQGDHTGIAYRSLVLKPISK
jgi:Domain of Unknown Function (DUF1080)